MRRPTAAVVLAMGLCLIPNLQPTARGESGRTSLGDVSEGLGSTVLQKRLYDPSKYDWVVRADMSLSRYDVPPGGLFVLELIRSRGGLVRAKVFTPDGKFADAVNALIAKSPKADAATILAGVPFRLRTYSSDTCPALERTKTELEALRIAPVPRYRPRLDGGSSAAVLVQGYFGQATYEMMTALENYRNEQDMAGWTYRTMNGILACTAETEQVISGLVLQERAKRAVE